MFKHFKLLLLSKTAFDSGIVLSGAVVSTIFGFLITILLARNLNAASLGIVLTSLTFTQLLVDLSEFGIGASILNFIPRDKDKKEVIIKTTFLIKFIVGALILSLVLVFTNTINDLMFKNTLITPFLRISAVGFFFLIFINWGQSILQAEKKFISSSILGAGVNLSRISVLLIIALLGFFSIFNIYWSIQLILLLVCVGMFCVIPFSFIKIKLKFSDFKRIFSFGAPIAVGFSLAALYTRVDQIFIFRFNGPVQASVYGLAFRVASVLLFVSSALGSATIPRFSSFSKAEFIPYFKKTVSASIYLSIISLIGIIMAPPILMFLFGDKFKDSVLPFQILSIGMLFFILVTPFYNAIIFFLRKPIYSIWNSFASLIIVTILLYMLIPKYQSAGAAIGVAALYLLQFIWTVSYFFICFRND